MSENTFAAIGVFLAAVILIGFMLLVWSFQRSTLQTCSASCPGGYVMPNNSMCICIGEGAQP